MSCEMSDYYCQRCGCGMDKNAVADTDIIIAEDEVWSILCNNCLNELIKDGDINDN